jgi:K+-sensing histidine kinase KdpD
MKTKETAHEKKTRLGQLRRILAVFDASEDSRRAVLHARRLARRHHARLSVVQVVPPLISNADFGYGPVQRRIVDGSIMQQTKRRLANLVHGRAASLVKCGSPGAQILKAAQDVGADLIVMGPDQNQLPEPVVCPILIVRRDGVELKSQSRAIGALQ